MQPPFRALLISACSFLVLALPGWAATVFPDPIPPELQRYFAGPGPIYSDLPDDFPPFDMPEGLRLMGSQAGRGQQLVLIRTSLDGADSQQLLVSEFLDRGWQSLPDINMSRDWGFIIPVETGQIIPLTLCHGDFGNLEIRGENGTENRVYMRRSGMNGNLDRNFCEAQRERLNYSGVGPPPDIEREPPLFIYLPNLALPEGIIVPVRIMAIMRNDDSLDRDVEITAPDWSVESLYAHFEPQLRALDWQAEEREATESAVSGNWRLVPEDGDAIEGRLVVEALGDDRFRLVFSMLRLGISGRQP